MKKRISLILLLGLILVGTQSVNVQADTTLSRCVQVTNGLFSPTTDCQLPYADSGTIISPAIICHHTSSIAAVGDITDPGRDYLLETNFVSLGRSGKASAPQTIAVNATVSAECQKYSDAYQLSGQVISPDGTKYPINFGSGTFSEGFQDLITTDYCFLELIRMCGFIDYNGSVSIPSSAISGMYAISMTLSPGSRSISSASAVTENFSSILDVSGVNLPVVSTPTPTPIPTTIQNIVPNIFLTNLIFTVQTDGNLVCYTPDFTSQAISEYGITGTHWRITTNIGQPDSILDEFDMSLGVQDAGDPIRTDTKNGAYIATLIKGNVYYSYALRNQVKDASYACAVAIKTQNGVTKYATQYATSTANTNNFNIVPAQKNAQISPSPTPSPTKTKPNTLPTPLKHGSSGTPKPKAKTPLISTQKAPVPQLTAQSPKLVAKANLNQEFTFMSDLIRALNQDGAICEDYSKNTTPTISTREEGTCHFNGQELTVDLFTSSKSAVQIIDAIKGIAGGYILGLKNWAIFVSDEQTTKLFLNSLKLKLY